MASRASAGFTALSVHKKLNLCREERILKNRFSLAAFEAFCCRYCLRQLTVSGPQSTKTTLTSTGMALFRARDSAVLKNHELLSFSSFDDELSGIVCPDTERFAVNRMPVQYSRTFD